MILVKEKNERAANECPESPIILRSGVEVGKVKAQFSRATGGYGRISL